MYPIVITNCTLEQNREWHVNSTAPTANTDVSVSITNSEGPVLSTERHPLREQ